MTSSPIPSLGTPTREEIAALIVDMTGAGTLGLTNDASLDAARPIADEILALITPVEAADVGGWRPIETGLVEMLSADSARMKSAGNALAAAACRVTDEYDGVHRLNLAVAEWCKAIADEGGRGERYAASPPLAEGEGSFSPQSEGEKIPTVDASASPLTGAV